MMIARQSDGMAKAHHQKTAAIVTRAPLGSLTISAVGASFSLLVFAKPPRQTCLLRPRRPPRTPGNSSPHAVAASQQLRLLLRSRPAPSPRRRSSGFSSAPPRLGLRRVPFISSRPGAHLCTLPAAADGSQHSLTPRCPRFRLVVDQRVHHPALSVSCASRDGRLVPRCAAVVAVSTPSRASQSLA